MKATVVRGLTLVAAGFLCWTATGCVAQSEYDAQLMQNRKLQEQLESERLALADLRGANQNLRNQLGMTEADRDRAVRQTGSLQDERNRLRSEYERAKAALEASLNAPMNEPIIIERKLPAALDSALKDFAAKHPDMVEFDSRNGVVKWKSDLVFALGSDVVRDSAKESIQSFAAIIRSPAASEFDVFIVGHTDNVPIVKQSTKAKHPTNWHLSAHRAISVKDVLAGAGVPQNRMGISGYADTRPAMASSGRGGNEKNRRVEIYLVPHGAVGLVGVQSAQR